MNREIKFRGQTITGELVNGNLSILEKDCKPIKKGHYLSNPAGKPFAYEVTPETIGQFTGLKDKNGIDIYEGDKIKIWSFYRQSGTTEEWFGSEPQNSHPCYEEFLEKMVATVEFVNGSYVARNINHEIPLYEIVKGLGAEVSFYYMCGNGGSADDFIECLSEPETVHYYEELKSLDGDDFYKRLEEIVNDVTSRIEVISNIHENPEILKETTV